MKITSLLATIAFLVTYSVDAAAGQTRDKTATAPQAGVVKGTVTAADTGVPLRRAQVRLTSSTSKESRVTTTNAEGVFEFTEVQAGRYSVLALKGGYVPLQYGQRRAFVSGTALDLSSGQRLDKVDVALVPGATVDGKILDEFGDPVADVVVITLRAQYAGGRKRLVAVGRAVLTNERGDFHLFGLPPGRYYISASLFGGQGTTDATNRSGYAPTYFPGTPDVGGAEAVDVGLGESKAGINLLLSTSRVSTVAGSAFDSDGRPLASGTVAIVNTVSGLPMPVAATKVAAEGTFSVSGVPPGQFTLQVVGSRSDGTQEHASQRITVSGEDLPNLHVVSQKTTSVSGRVSVRPGEVASLAAQNVRLRLVNAEPSEDLTSSASAAPIVADANGAFMAAGRPGTMLIELASAPPGWHLDSVWSGGEEITDRGLRLASGEASEELQVLLTSRPTSISGSVLDRSGKPVSDYAVLVFPKDKEKWTYKSRFIAGARPDQKGRFEVRGLPVGEYHVVAIDYVEQGEAQDPEFLETIAGRATHVVLGNADKKDLELRLHLRQ